VIEGWYIDDTVMIEGQFRGDRRVIEGVTEG
jgi:hypothetical protein